MQRDFHHGLLSWLAPTPDEALSGIRELVNGVLVDMRADGESPPAPLADRAVDAAARADNVRR